MRPSVRVKPQIKGKDFDNWVNKILHTSLSMLKSYYLNE